MKTEPLTLDPAQTLTGCTDASTWANQFMRRFDGTQADEGTMLGWFANAIEAGHTAGRTTAREELLADARTLGQIPPGHAERRAEVLLEMIEVGLINPDRNPGTNAVKRALQFVLGQPVEEKA